jgi:alpha-L-fucosidase 2
MSRIILGATARKIILVLTLSLICVSAFCGNDFKNDMMMWYRQPGKEWLDGMPIGNGYMGAMVFGGTGTERIALNESSFWSGSPHDYNDPNAYRYFPKIRDLVFAEKFQEAEKLADEHFWGIPAAQQAYEPLGDLFLSFDDSLNVINYRRQLDMETGITSVSYRVGDVTYTREVFLSYPDRVLVVRITADKPGRISVHAGLKSPFQDTITSNNGTKLILDGQWKKDAMKENWLIANMSGQGIRFRTVLEAFPEGGKSSTGNNHLDISRANAVTFVLTAATSYINYQDISGNPVAICAKILSGVKGENYETLKKRHITDFDGLMGRVHLQVGDPAENEKPTDERIQAMHNGGKDANLEALCFQFGRYILASSSRNGGQPANLQGIWNEKVDPNWGSKYTININTQMNYWPAEVCNLSECTQPLFDMIKDISVTGAKTAKIYYNSDGWVTHHNIDLWRGTAPVDAARFGMWPVGGAWLCLHLWEHYAFTGDLEFLKKYYPVMKGSAEFLLSLMVEDPKHHWLVTPFSMSPEHGYYDSKGNMSYLSSSPTMDVGIIRELFPHCIEAAKLLGVDSDLSNKLQMALTKIPPYQIGKSGFLQEWIEDWEPGPQGHNFSRNFPFFPGSSIQLHRDKELADAMMKWMESRRGGGGAFPLSWNICMWSRLERGDKVADCINQFVANSVANDLHNRGANQSDATFGFSAGVAESLIQSHEGIISLLPALDSNWKDGSVTGLRARGGFEVSMTWRDGKLLFAKISNRDGGFCNVRYGDKMVLLKVEQGKTIVINSDLSLLSN